MRKNSTLAIIAILLSGCASTQSERVYVDLNRVMASEKVQLLPSPPIPTPSRAASAVTVKQAGLPSSSITDRTRERLETAKRLIAENRGKSIAALSAMLKRIYLAKAEDQIAIQTHDIQPQQDALIAAAFADIRTAFEEYGQKRGPLLVRLNLLARNTELKDQIPPADPVAAARVKKANALRGEVRALDAQYNALAAKLLAEADAKIQAAIAALDEQAKQIRTQAESKAVGEAELKANQTQTTLDVQIKQLVPERLAAVPARQVVVPGSTQLPSAPTDTDKPIFGSLDEVRHMIDQEVDIWVGSIGRTRSTSPKGGRDATEEFLQWRSAHKVGP